MIMVLIAVILTLVLVVGFHEAGHALAAKWFAVKIHQISIGFGKPLLRWKGKAGRPDWVWSIWPLGGYAKLLNSRIQAVSKSELPFSFDKKSATIRCLILLAGPLANWLVAWLALTIFFMIGYERNLPIIREVIPQTVAATAGLKVGERFIEIANGKTNSWHEVGMRLIMNLGKANVVAIVSTPAAKTRKIYFDLRPENYNWQSHSLLIALGINPGGDFVKKRVEGQSFAAASAHALIKAGQQVAFFLIMLKQLLTGTIPFLMLLGPIGLFILSSSSLLQGITVFLDFIASLSLAVGLVNLFPLPGLDGGSILYILIEKIRGKPISIAMEVLLYRLAIIWVSLLLFQLLLNDLQLFLHF